MKEKTPVEIAIDRYHSSMLDMTVARVAKEMAGRDLDEAKLKYESAMDRLAATQDASDAAKVTLRELLMRAIAESIAPAQKAKDEDLP